MPIQAQSADGQIHEFPDGTSGAVIDRAMRQYAMDTRTAATPEPVTTFGLPTADAPQPGDAPTTESVIGAPPKPTGFLPVDTVREYPYQVESAARFGGAMFKHGANALFNEGKPSGIVGMLAGAPIALASPISGAFGPVSRPVRDFIGNPVEAATGIPADITTAAVFAAPGVFKGPRAPTVEAPPATRVGALKGGEVAETQRSQILDRIQADKAAAYDRSEKAGVIIKPDALAGALQEINKDLAEFSYKPSQQPGIAPVLQDLADVVEGRKNVTLKGLDTIRKGAVNLTKDFNNPSQQEAAGIVLDHLANLEGNLRPHDVIVPEGGNLRAAVDDLLQGRNLAKVQAKARMVDQALTLAKNNAEANGSGANAENAVRQALKSILNRIDKRQIRTFSKEEVGQLRMAVRGGSVNNMLRWAGRYSPDFQGYSALGATVGGTAGFLFGGPAGALVGGSAVPALGAASKLSSEAINRYRANKVFNTITEAGRR